MLKVEIKTGGPEETGVAQITAAGSVTEIVRDVAILINGIYNQFKATSPETAALFRRQVEILVEQPDDLLWGTLGDQTGIAFKMG